MYFKTLNKITGEVEGWGKDKSLEEYCKHWYMNRVNVIEITEDEYHNLFKEANIEEEVSYVF